MKINGPLVIDLNLWNDHIDVGLLSAGGVSSVILGLYKQWDGSKWVLNTNCQRIAGQLKNSPFVIQTYYYLYPENDPVVESNWYTNAIATSGLDVRFSWSDCENAQVLMGSDVRSEKYRIFTDACASKFSNTGVYTNKDFIVEHAPDMDKWINKYPAWVPQYGHQPVSPLMVTWDQLKSSWLPNYDIILSSGQINPVAHQFTGDRLELPGVYNYANQEMTLDVSEFTSAFIDSIKNNIPIPTPVPVPTPPVTNQYYININLANVRSGPSTAYPIIGTIGLNSVVTVYGSPMNGYSEIGTNQWVFSQYLSKK
jgi:hypothetical protein